MKWKRFIVWDQLQEDFLKQYCPNSKYIKVGYVDITGLSKNYHSVNGKKILSIFDVTPIRPITLSKFGIAIPQYYSEELNIKFIQDSQSGTGGDLLHIEKELKNESEFLLWFVDNLCAVDVKKMRNIFKEKKSSACIATRTKRKEETGFAIVENGIIKEFKEKPIMKLQLSECLGIYMLRKEIIQKIKKKKQKQVNLSYDILQQLSKEGKVSAYDIAEREWIDAESPMILERNQKTVKKIIKQMGL